MYSEGLKARSPQRNTLALSGENVGDVWDAVGNNEPVGEARAEVTAAEVGVNERAMLDEIKEAVAAASVIVENLKDVKNLAKGGATP